MPTWLIVIKKTKTTEQHYLIFRNMPYKKFPHLYTKRTGIESQGIIEIISQTFYGNKKPQHMNLWP